LSVGIEDCVDLLADLQQAMANLPTQDVGEEELVPTHSEA
jgi:hypothetical protein